MFVGIVDGKALLEVPGQQELSEQYVSLRDRLHVDPFDVYVERTWPRPRESTNGTELQFQAEIDRI